MTQTTPPAMPRRCPKCGGKWGKSWDDDPACMACGKRWYPPRPEIDAQTCMLCGRPNRWPDMPHCQSCHVAERRWVRGPVVQKAAALLAAS